MSAENSIASFQPANPPPTPVEPPTNTRLFGLAAVWRTTNNNVAMAQLKIEVDAAATDVEVYQILLQAQGRLLDEGTRKLPAVAEAQLVSAGFQEVPRQPQLITPPKRLIVPK